MGRANGDDFTPPLAELDGPEAACQNGDVLTATAVGDIISAYINGRKVLQGEDSVITAGGFQKLFVDCGNKRRMARCTNRCTKTSLPCPMSPTVADYCTRTLLILRGPAGELPPVTAEAGGSSPVVPAIHSKAVKSEWN